MFWTHLFLPCLDCDRLPPMDILPWFAPEVLSRWESRSVHPRSQQGPTARAHHDRHHRIVAVEPAGPPQPQGAFERVAESILHYRIFPLQVGTPVLADSVCKGATVGLRYRLLPGLHLFFASRVVDVFEHRSEELWRSGFTYQTLVGHPEVGEETFWVEKNLASGAVEAGLQAWSELNFAWLRPLEPLCRWLQLSAGRSALDYLEQVANASAANPAL